MKQPIIPLVITGVLADGTVAPLPTTTATVDRLGDVDIDVVATDSTVTLERSTVFYRGEVDLIAVIGLEEVAAPEEP